MNFGKRVAHRTQCALRASPSSEARAAQSAPWIRAAVRQRSLPRQDGAVECVLLVKSEPALEGQEASNICYSPQVNSTRTGAAISCLTHYGRGKGSAPSMSLRNLTGRGSALKSIPASLRRASAGCSTRWQRSCPSLAQLPPVHRQHTAVGPSKGIALNHIPLS